MSNTNTQEAIEKIKKHLKNKGFYQYQDTASFLNALSSELGEATSLRNKRNILFEHSWQDLTSFGEPRSLLVIELGGSFLRLMDVEIVETSLIEIKKTEKIDFYNKDRIYTPDVLFGDIVEHLNSFVGDSKRNQIKDSVLIFTFPIEQYKRNDGSIDAIAIKINKKIKHNKIVGIKVGKTFEELAHQHGYQNLKVSVTNDTVTSLLSSKYIELNGNHSFDAAINIIVGTGTNIAVGYNRADQNNKLFIANTEFGYFKCFPMSEYDTNFNQTSSTKDQSLAEKMISGLWQPHIFKLIVEDLISAKLLTAEALQFLENTELQGHIIEQKLANETDKSEIYKLLDFIWMEQTVRGATLCGITLAHTMSTILEKTKTERIRIGLVEEGGVLKHARQFATTMYQTIDHQLSELAYREKIKYTSLNPDNKSALGSAVLNSIIRKRL